MTAARQEFPAAPNATAGQDALTRDERAELEMLRRTVRVIALIADDTFGDPVEWIAAVREALRE